MAINAKCGACGADDRELEQGVYAVRTKWRVIPTPAKLCQRCRRFHASVFARWMKYGW